MDDPGRPTDLAARIREVIFDCVRRRASGEILPDEAVIAAHPDLMPELAERLRDLAIVNGAYARIQAGPTDSTGESAAAQAKTLLTPSALDPAELTEAAKPVVLPQGESIPGYEILREIHRGGQGVVYQAIQKSTKRKVAIKVMKEGPFAGAADKARFEREVQILGQLQHPNIVGVHDSGSVAGNFYFVMDYIPGQPLDVYMAGAAEKEPGTKGSKDHGRVGLSIESTLKLFAKICEAVNAAHLRGIIHRDLKPGNIRVDPAGEPHILDFGLAKVALSGLAGDTHATPMTLTGEFVGSLPWASPEQAEGMPSKIDVRTDVYSLGVILYQMLTGKFPYEVVGNMRDVLDRILRAEPAKPSTMRKEINDEVETIVLKCLSKERERRYQSAGELARDIGHYLAGEPIEAKRDSFGYLLGKQLRRYRLPVAVGAAFVVLVTVGLIVTFAFWRMAASQRDKALEAERLAVAAQRAEAEQRALALQRYEEAERERRRAEMEVANAEFRMKTARNQAASAFEDQLLLLPLARRAEELTQLLPPALRAESPEAIHEGAREWVQAQFPRESAGATAPGRVPRLIEKAMDDFLATCTPLRSTGVIQDQRRVLLFDWLRSNQERVSSVIETTRQRRLSLPVTRVASGTMLTQGVISKELLPVRSDARFLVKLLVTNAAVSHLAGDARSAVESLRAAVRIARGFGDGGELTGLLTEIACRRLVYAAYLWMMVNAAQGGGFPDAYLEFIHLDPPTPRFESWLQLESQITRQEVDESFVRLDRAAPPTLDRHRYQQLLEREGIKAERDYSERAPDYAQTLDFLAEVRARFAPSEMTTFRKINDAGRWYEEQRMARPITTEMFSKRKARENEIQLEGQMHRDATIIAAALLVHRCRNANWPENIDAALETFPVKPASRTYYEHDFVFRVVDDELLLYTVGPNEHDDGGGGDDVLFVASQFAELKR